MLAICTSSRRSLLIGYSIELYLYRDQRGFRFHVASRMESPAFATVIDRVPSKDYYHICNILGNKNESLHIAVAAGVDHFNDKPIRASWVEGKFVLNLNWLCLACGI